MPPIDPQLLTDYGPVGILAAIVIFLLNRMNKLEDRLSESQKSHMEAIAQAGKDQAETMRQVFPMIEALNRVADKIGGSNGH